MLILAILFTLTICGAVSAADNSSNNGTVLQDNSTNVEQAANNSTTNDSQTLPDPTLIPYNGNPPVHYATIQEAYNAAAVGTSTQMDTIELEENGVFTLSDFTIAKNLIFTVANGGTATIQGSGNRLIYIAPGYTVYFYNITFENGHASDGTILHPDGYNGGAIYNEGTLYLTNCVLRNNQAGDGGSLTYGGIGGNGGAIYNTGSATITDCEIYGNRAGDGSDGVALTHSDGFHGGHGGAIYSTGTLTISSSELYNNFAGDGGNGVVLGEGGNGGNGGAIYSAGTMDITDTGIHDNFAGDAGAGGTKIIIGGMGGTGGNGGGIYNTGTATITDSEISSNIAGNGGSGADADDGGLIHPDGYTGHSGGAGGNGGAIYNTGHLEISDTEIADNSAGNGGIGGNGGNAIQNPLQPRNGGAGGQGGSGGNAGGIFNSNYLMITESTVSSNRSGNGGTGGAGGKGSDRWSYTILWTTTTVPSGSGGNGGNGGSAGSGAGIYHSGNYLEVTSNNLTDNQLGTPGIGGAAGSKGTGTGGSNGNPGTAGTSGNGSAFYSTVNVPNPQGLHFNRILNNDLADVAAANGVNVNAENNWWGTNFEGTNPFNAGRVNSGVDGDPWLVLTVTADPTAIHNGDTSQVTADLTHNSDGQDTSSQGHVPDGIHVDFSFQGAPLGTLDTNPAYTINGIATTTFTANAVGISHVLATVDSQTAGPADIQIDPVANIDLYKEFRSDYADPLSVITTAKYGNDVYGMLRVTNNGPDDATNITIHDTYTGYDYQGGYWVSYDNGSNWIYQDTTSPFDGADWIIPFLGNGQSIWLAIGGPVECTGEDAVTNVANETAQDQYHGDWPGAYASLDVSAAAYLTVNKEFRDTLNGSAISTAHYGDWIWTVLEVWNNGPDSVWAIIKDTPYAGLDLSDSGWYYSIDGGATWNLGDGSFSIYNSSTHEWTVWMPELTQDSNWYYLAIPTQVTQTGILANEVEQTWQDVYAPEPFDHNTVNLDVPRQADVYVITTANKTKLNIGENVIITVKVGNNGPDTAQGVVVSYTLPKGFKFVCVTADAGLKPVYDPVTRTITWNIGDVPVGDPHMYITLKAVSSGTFENTAKIIEETTYDPNTDNKSSSITINVQKPSKHKAHAATIPLHHTGLPLAGLVLAVLAVFSGLVMPKRKN
jgi:uncharacterized repeat protein (TIGR01451 family)